MRSRRLLTALTAGGMALAGFAAAPPPAVAAPTPVTIYANQLRWPKLSHWGYDIKQNLAARKLANNPDWARWVFGNGKMRVIRVPIHAEEGWVDSQGRLGPDEETKYATVVRAIKNALAVNPNLTIFANRVTVKDGGQEFAAPLWSGTGDSRHVNMRKYGVLLADYLKFINRELAPSGGKVSILGIENEPHNNDGNISPSRFARAIDSLNAAYDPPLPKLIMNDAARPDVTWLDKALLDSDYWGKLTYASTHYQSLIREDNYSAFRDFSNTARFHPDNKSRRDLVAWETEFHWDDSDGTGQRRNGASHTNPEKYWDAKHGILATFDHADLGYRGVTWWAFRPCRTGDKYTCSHISGDLQNRDYGVAKAEMQNALVDSMGRANRLRFDGTGDVRVATRGSITTRVFRVNRGSNGDHIYVWVVNDTSVDRYGLRINVPAAEITNPVVIDRWRKARDGTEELTRSTHRTKSPIDGDVEVGAPARSMTLVRLDFGPGALG